MRKKEKDFKPSFRESRDAYLERLRRTAMSMPPSYLEPLVKSLRRRCQALIVAKGGHFEE